MLAQVLLLGQQDIEGNFLVEVERDFMFVSAHDRSFNVNPCAAPEMQGALDGVVQVGNFLSGNGVTQAARRNIQHNMSFFFQEEERRTFRDWIANAVRFAPLLTGLGLIGLSQR